MTLGLKPLDSNSTTVTRTLCAVAAGGFYGGLYRGPRDSLKPSGRKGTWHPYKGVSATFRVFLGVNAHKTVVGRLLVRQGLSFCSDPYRGTHLRPNYRIPLPSCVHSCDLIGDGND